MSFEKIEKMEAMKAKYPDVSPMLILKLSMTLEGAVFSEAAIRRIQEPDIRFSKGDPFGISFDALKAEVYMPGPIILRDGSNVFINYGEPYENPYLIDWDPEAGTFFLSEDGKWVDEFEFVPRPAFFDKFTSLGTPMSAVGDVRAQRLILNSFQKCRFWEEGNQCHFCAFFTTPDTLGEVNAQDLKETVQEALKEPGRYSEITLSGGSDFTGDPPFSNEINRYIEHLQAIGECFSGRFPIQLMAPAYRKEDLRRIHDETGVSGYSPNIEIADKETFERFCPGKTKWIGYDEWIRRTCDAVEVFGKGKVDSQLVNGAELAVPGGMTDVEEALDKDFKLCEFLAKNGVNLHTTIWRPHKAERLGYQPMQDIEFYIRLAKGFHEIHREYGLYACDSSYKRAGDQPDVDTERGDF